MITPLENTDITEKNSTYIEFELPTIKRSYRRRQMNTTSFDPEIFTLIPTLGFGSRYIIENSYIRVANGEINLNKIFEDIKKSQHLYSLIENTLIEAPDLTAKINFLRMNYSFRQPSEVNDYLSENALLIPFLMEAHKKIRKYFVSSKLVLEVFADPEAENDSTLLILIITKLTPSNAFKQLEKLDKYWWLDASLEVGEKVCIHVEFE